MTGWLDLSVIYGSASERAIAIRTMQNGKIEMQAGGNLAYNHKGIANLNLFGKKIERLVVSGDNRVNVQPGLLTMHTLWAREHNRVADELLAKDPTMTDRNVFLLARAATIATYQSVLLYEWLPTVLGAAALRRHHLNSYADGGGYQPDSIDARVANEFASVAFRFGHSQVTDILHRLGADGKSTKYGHLHLRDNYFSPGRVLKQGGLDPILRGMILTASQEVDTKAVDGVRNFLFGTNTKGFDLVALNIQRGRDHGIPDYNSLREALGLKRRASFKDITSDADVAAKLDTLYGGKIDDVDAFVAGLAEDHVEGGAVGELFATIIGDQFRRLRNGDRLWFENTAQKIGLDIDAIRKTTMADVVNRNSGLDFADVAWQGIAEGRSAFRVPGAGKTEM